MRAFWFGTVRFFFIFFFLGHSSTSPSLKLLRGWSKGSLKADGLFYVFVEGKKLTSAELQVKLSEGEEVVKAVYRFVPPPPFLLPSLRSGESSYQESLWKKWT